MIIFTSDIYLPIKYSVLLRPDAMIFFTDPFTNPSVMNVHACIGMIKYKKREKDSMDTSGSSGLDIFIPPIDPIKHVSATLATKNNKQIPFVVESFFK